MAKVLEPKPPIYLAVRETETKEKRDYKESFDRRNGTRELPQHQLGDWIRAKLDNEKRWTTEAKVVCKDSSPRSYVIDTGCRKMRRNRKHLRKVPRKAEKSIQQQADDALEDDYPIPGISKEQSFPKLPKRRLLLSVLIAL